MANFVVNSSLRFARNIILAENMQFRSSPLHVAARRWRQAFEKSAQNEQSVQS